MAAELIQLHRGRGRPSAVALSIANDHLRAEVHSLRAERREDIEAIRPAAHRLAMVAREFGPEALGAAHLILERLERMERRDRKVLPFGGDAA